MDDEENHKNDIFHGKPTITTEQAVHTLVDLGYLPKYVLCKCGKRLDISPVSNTLAKDLYAYRCSKYGCRKYVGL